MTITLGRAIKLFLDDYKPSTRRAYAGVLHPMANFIGPDRPLRAVGVEHIQEYIHHFAARDVKSATYNKHVKSIRTFFNWCIRATFVETSPAIMLKRRRISRLIPRDKAMSEDDYRQLVSYAQWDARYHALVLFLGDTGCRIGGAAGLQWNDIDWLHRSAPVTEKGDKTRPVFFGEICLQALRRWRLVATLKNGSYVFSLRGGAIKSANLAQAFRRICLNAGIGSHGPHELRHRLGHRLADARVAPSLAAQALGHESPMTTVEYYYPDDWERVQEALSQLATSAGETPSKVRKFRAST